MSIQGRIYFVMGGGRCTICLNRAHPGGEASCYSYINGRSEYKCTVCEGFHHPLICAAELPPNSAIPEYKIFVGHANQIKGGANFLKETLTPHRHFYLPAGGKIQNANVFYDSGSSVSFILEEKARKLNLPVKSKCYFSFEGVGDMSSDIELKNVYSIKCKRLDGTLYEVDLIGMTNITTLPGTQIGGGHELKVKLANGSVTKKDFNVDILMGNDAISIFFFMSFRRPWQCL